MSQELAAMSDQDLRDEIAAIEEEIADTATSLTVDAEHGKPRGESWRIRATDRIVHLRREQRPYLNELKSRKQPVIPKPGKDPGEGIAKQQRLMAEAEERREAKRLEGLRLQVRTAELAAKRRFSGQFLYFAKEMLDEETFAVIEAKAREVCDVVKENTQ